MTKQQQAAGAVSDAEDPRINRTRTAVHEAGLAILFDSGAAGITHASVAAATGMSRTTLYKHWPTRVDLLSSIYNELEPGHTTELTGDLRTDFVALATDVAETLRDPQVRRGFSSLLAQAQFDPDALKVANALTGDGLAAMADLLETACSAGRLPPGLDSQEIAARLLGPILFGALVTHRTTSPTEVETIVDTLLASLALGPSAGQVGPQGAISA